MHFSDIMKLARGYTNIGSIDRPLGYERVYLPLYKVTDTPFHIQGHDIVFVRYLHQHDHEWAGC